MFRLRILSTFIVLILFGISNLQAQSLADEVIGTYTGTLGVNGDKTNDYSITITRITDTTVRIAPVSGDASTVFKATVSEEVLGSIRTIAFSTEEDIMLQNATLVPTAGRFAYAIVKVNEEGRDIEIFNGSRQ